MDAVGKENVIGVGMPGPYSSEHSVIDARDLARNLGIRFELIPIKNQYGAFLECAGAVVRWAGHRRDGGEPAIAPARRHVDGALEQMGRAGAHHRQQERTGSGILHAVRRHVRRAGGDQRRAEDAGLFAGARRQPAASNAIPENTFTKPPSAELRPDQKDTDSLPPYEVLDQILRLYIENNDAPQQIADALHLPVTLVRDIVNKVDRNEYKRQQAAPGLKVTTKAFGMARFPCTAVSEYAQRFSE